MSCRLQRANEKKSFVPVSNGTDNGQLERGRSCVLDSNSMSRHRVLKLMKHRTLSRIRRELAFLAKGDQESSPHLRL